MGLTTLTLSVCPVCDHSPTPLGVEIPYHLNTLNERVSIHYAVCNQCGFVFQANPLSWESLSQYYSTSPRYRSPELDAWDRQLYQNQLHFIEEATALKRGCRVIDIGADMGKMLDLLKDKYDCATFFMEENEAGRKYIRGHGRHREVPDLDDAGCFDWCILSEVLEHIVQPVGFLKKVREHLEPNGNLYVEVPSHSFWDEREYGFAFEHVNYFSTSSLTLALQKAGFLVTKLAITSDKRYFSGKIGIIRAIATPTPAAVRDQLSATVCEHERQEFGDRFRAAEALANHYCEDGQPGMALYGAAELANLLFSNTTIGPTNIIAVLDTDKRKHGQNFHGFTVTGADSAKNVRAVLILSSAEKVIRDHLLECGYSGEIIGWSELKK